MTETYDSYELETGLKQSFDLTIATANFTFDAAYNSGQTLCLIVEGVDGDGDPQRLLYSCSPGWTHTQDLQTAVREDGAQNRRFNQNSGVGTFILAALQCGAPLKSRGLSTNAGIWPGLAFHFERQTVNKGGDYETTRALPTALLNAAAPAAPAAVAPVAQPAAAPAAAPPAPNGNGSGIDALTMAKLKALAKKVSSHDQFIEEGLALADGKPEVEVVLADPAQFAALQAS